MTTVRSRVVTEKTQRREAVRGIALEH